MKSITRSVFVVVVVVMAFSATAAASASAAEWYVGGSPLKEATPVAPTTTTTEGVTMYSTFIGTIACKSVELKGANLTATAGGQVEHLLLKGCRDEGGSGCHLTSETIETKALKLEAALGGKSPEDTLVLKPVTGTTWAEFVVEGGTCSGDDRLQGKATFVLSKGREEAAEQELYFGQKESGELKIGAVGAELKGKIKLKLASAKGWSFH